MSFKRVDYYDIDGLLSDEEIAPLVVNACDREEPLNMAYTR